MIDQQLVLCENQAVTASAASTNVIDMQALGKTGYRSQTLERDNGIVRMVPLEVKITEAFNNLTSLTIAIQTCDAEGFGSGVFTEVSYVVPLASLTTDYRLPYPMLPPKLRGRYLRVYFTVTGKAPTAGKASAYLASSAPYPYQVG